ncbi:MAG: RsmF rRNA methyltransferase first C-terminal domain-containing protein [Lachnospiraceae bacterium]|nr:RsmF rRNA methyltransferase first C-terminal domain-containing protein [Lachnospiraceae bacterium]MDD6192453.1 RsmF rRNA methyltransferase first C-terminal domain-containing protein [Lachnospiraceae bacterium]MDY4793792.1 RsmF rRNA methyltransferase first C-terminal domain-containing protein [Pararoseburia sp.]
MIPKEFGERMKKMLPQEEYEAFIQSYDKERYQSLRFNPLKGERENFLQKTPFHLQPVPWEENGFYYEKEDFPGKHPYHEAGVYYIQEPSAMAPAAYLEAEPGERVLDLCGAPGGKSTQIAASMQGRGLLVSNEIHPARAKILSENMERMGIKNALVVNETPQNLRKFFGCFFHRIMVDAPCSGEGLFRKQEDAYQEWSLDNVKMCGERQDEILEEAYQMLLPGGRMVYSTCTFAPDENEGSISRLIYNHPDMSLVEVKKYPGMGDGNASWFDDFATHDKGENPVEGIERTIRLWPHKLHGEGHFVAVLEKQSSEDETARELKPEKTVSFKELKELQAFAKETLTDTKTLEKERFLLFGEQVYLAPEELPRLKGLKVLRPGLHLGTLKKNRFEPSHAWALALRPEQVKNCWDLSWNSQEIGDYLKGQTINAAGEKGWYLICVDGYSVGWGKLVGTTMKNHYPKGLRK